MKKTIFILIALAFLLLPGVSLAGATKITINKAYHLLYVENGSNAEMLIPVCVGEGDDNETPTGNYKIVNIVNNPKWYFEGKTYAPFYTDKENGLGVMWMGISLPSYGLHGTNEPFSIGSNLSHGCIRMENTDVQRLAKISFVGEIVDIKEGKNDSIAKHLKSINSIYTITNVLKGSK